MRTRQNFVILPIMFSNLGNYYCKKNVCNSKCKYSVPKSDIDLLDIRPTREK
jgi:hypothetical protein